MAGVTRREFIHATGALGITLTLGRLQLGCEEAAAPPGTVFARDTRLRRLERSLPPTLHLGLGPQEHSPHQLLVPARL